MNASASYFIGLPIPLAFQNQKYWLTVKYNILSFPLIPGEGKFFIIFSGAILLSFPLYNFPSETIVPRLKDKTIVAFRQVYPPLL